MAQWGGDRLPGRPKPRAAAGGVPSPRGQARGRHAPGLHRRAIDPPGMPLRMRRSTTRASSALQRGRPVSTPTSAGRSRRPTLAGVTGRGVEGGRSSPISASSSSARAPRRRCGGWARSREAARRGGAGRGRQGGAEAHPRIGRQGRGPRPETRGDRGPARAVRQQRRPRRQRGAPRGQGLVGLGPPEVEFATMAVLRCPDAETADRASTWPRLEEGSRADQRDARRPRRVEARDDRPGQAQGPGPHRPGRAPSPP